MLKHVKTKIFTVFLIATIFLLVFTTFYPIPFVWEVRATSKLRYGTELQSAYWSSTVGYMTPARFTTYAEEWGFNTIAFQDIFWAHIERDYYQPQVYHQPTLDNLHIMVNRAKAVGLDVILNFFIDYGADTYSDGWASHDYVVHDAGWVNDDWYYGGDYGAGTANIWATGGRARLGEFIEDMAEEFNNCIINPNKFPYHGTGANSDDYEAWSEVTFPILLEAIRNTSNHEPVVFTPVHQDSNDWNHQDSWYDDSYGVILGLGHTIPWGLDGGHSDNSFDAEDETWIDNKLAGAYTFRGNFPNEDIMSIEYGGLATPQAERPPSDERLAALEYSLEHFEALRAGWAYHTMSWRMDSDTLLNYQPNHDSMIPEPNIFALLQDHMLPAGEPEFLTWSCGFEKGNLSDWDLTSGTTSVTSTYAYAGSYSANLTAGVGGGGGWLSGWDKRVKLTLDHNDFDEVLTDFPLYVHICGTAAGRYDEDISFVFDEVGSNSRKIAFTTSDGQTQLYGDTELWDSSAECARMWVKVPSISNTTDTVLYLYYDNDHADNPYINDSGVGNAVNVWDSDFMLVQHMTGAAYSDLDDSTSNHNDVSAEHGTPTYNQAGRCAKAVDFEASSDEYLNVTDDDTLDGYNVGMTLESWVKLETVNIATIFGKYEPSGNQRSYFAQVSNTTRLQFYFSSGGDKYCGYEFSGQTYSTGIWYYLVFEWISDQTPKAYCNGVPLTPVQMAKTETDWTTSTINNCNEDLMLGNKYDDEDFDGLLDEMRLSGEIARSEAWIDGCYEVERDETIDWFTEETEDGGESASITHITVAMSELYMRSFVRLEDLPDTNASAIKLMEFQTMGGTLIASAMVYREDSTYYWAVQVGGENWNEGNRTSSTIMADTDFGVELYANVTANGNVTLWVNEELKCEDLGDYLGLGEIQKVVLYSQIYGSQSSAKSVFHDSFEVNDQRIYGGCTPVFKVAFFVYGESTLPDVTINGTHVTDSYGYYEWENLTYNTIYTFIVEKPVGFYPLWVLNVEGSFSWNTTHYILSHNTTEAQEEPIGIYFNSQANQPYINTTDAKLTSASLNNYLLDFTAYKTGGTSTTDIYTSGQGNATWVYNSQSWSYNAGTDIVQVVASHSSSKSIEVSWGFMATYALENQNANYKYAGVVPYLTNSNGTITTLSSSTSESTFTIQHGSGTSQTDVYTLGLGVKNVTGQSSYDYDGVNNNLTIYASHLSDVIVEVEWEASFHSYAAYAQSYQVYGDGFHVLFESGSSLAFQHDLNQIVTLEIETGVLNSSQNTVRLDSNGGYFGFTALNATQITIDFVGIDTVQVAGDQNNENHIIASGTTITIDAGNNVVISWNFIIKPWLPFLFIIGMIGLGASFAGPLYTVNKIKEKEYYEGFRTGLILTVIGIAFVLAWLW